MTAQRCEAAPGANLSYQVVDAFGNAVEVRVVGGVGDLGPKPADYAGGYLQIGRAGFSEGKIYLTAANVSDLLGTLQQFARFGAIT